MKKDLYGINKKMFMAEKDSPCLIGWNDENVAFIKNSIVSNNEIWGVYNAEGTQLAVVDSRDFAFVVARQNNLNPRSVH